MYATFQDKLGFIHLNENPSITESENQPLFTAATELLMRLNGTSRVGMLNTAYELLNPSKGEFVTHPYTEWRRFSHDNMTGMYIARELGLHSINLPICKWPRRDKNYWLHPRDLIYYSTLSYNPIGSILLPLLLIMAAVSYMAKREVTSGKCLWFYRLSVLTLSGSAYRNCIGRLGLWLGEKMLKCQHGSEPFKDVFGFYFKNPNHPVNQEIQKWYVKH